MIEATLERMVGWMKDVTRRVERLEAEETPRRFVPLITPATSTAFDGDLYDVDNDGTTIDLSASFGIPAGVKAIAVSISGTCLTAGRRFRIGPSATYGYALAIHSVVANQWIDNSGVVPCDANGDIYFTTDAVHGAEFGIYMRIWGYWI